ncbi:MAG: heavy-metal-associated domain-containing protein [Candidatus Nanopelagicales bacterium]|nr:heavy-metal-associated domain-containing protein [Candidatus Nanopelagicales bacterium]
MNRTFLVRGMTCAHCVSSVTEEITEVPGVLSVSVDLVIDGDSVVNVESGSEIDEELIRAAIDEAGYDLVG